MAATQKNQLFDPGFLFTPSDSFSLKRTVLPQYRTLQTDDGQTDDILTQCTKGATDSTVGQKPPSTMLHCIGKTDCMWLISQHHLLGYVTVTCSPRQRNNMATRKLSVVKELYDMTECCICNESFTDARVLPCIHTFCLNCLMNCGKDKRPGDRMPCPLCRKEFTIPADGLSRIQKNFFMKKLVSARKLSAGEEAGHILCDACSSDETRRSEAKPATKHCFQCQRNYCDQCSQSHGKTKAIASHATVEIGKELQKEEIALRLPTTCETHKGKVIEVFCLECQLAICMKCFMQSHKTHDCSDIEEVSIDRRKQMKNDTDKIREILKKTEGVLPRLEKEENDLANRLADIESEINTAADKLIAVVERDRVKLLSEVESIKLKRTKQLESVKQEVEEHMTAMESLKQYSETLLSNGTAGDVTRSANSLHSRAEELMMFDVISHVDSSLPSLNVNFTSSTLLGTENLVGTVAEEGLYLRILCRQCVLCKLGLWFSYRATCRPIFHINTHRGIVVECL